MSASRYVVAFLLGVSLLPAQQVTFTPFHANGTYRLGEPAGWTASVTGTAPAGCEYTILKNSAEAIAKGRLDLASGRGTIETTVKAPAMLEADVTCTGFKARLGAAVAPWKLKPTAPRPADFDAFWDAKLKALADIPIHPVLTPTKTSEPGIEFYTVKLDSLGSHVQGYLAKPAREGKFPALMIYQWAGVYKLIPELAAKAASEGWLAFDVESHDMPPDEATAPKDYQAVGNTDREKSYFLNMYLRDRRAIDYIASRPDWNGRTLVVTGTSMGGHQSLVAAALDSKVTAVVVNEPSGADSHAALHGRKEGYPNWPSDNPQVMKTALYFDTVNFAPRIKAPVLAAIGWIDSVCPPAGVWTAVNQIPGPKEVIPMIESDHNNLTPDKQQAWNARSKEVLDLLLHGGTFHPNQALTRPAN